MTVPRRRLGFPPLGGRLRGLFVALVVLAALGQAQLSSAGTVTFSDGTLDYTAAAGEQNRIFVVSTGMPGFRIFDMTTPLTAGSGCQSVSANEAFCSVVQPNGPATVVIHVAAGDLNDFIEVDAAGYQRAVLEGGEGADELQGGIAQTVNVLDGGPGSDIFRPAQFVDADVVDYSSRTSPVNVTVGDGLANDGEAGEQDLIQDGIGAVWGGAANDTIAGHTGTFENVELFGRGGDDTLTADGGDASGLRGGEGDDTLVSAGSSRADGASMYGGAGDDVLRGGKGWDYFEGGAGNDRLRCGEGGSSVYAGPGADRIVGGPGFDGMLGGDGPDTLFARDGKRDSVRGGGGRDRARVDRHDRLRSVEVLF